jgi:hypothetical protein
LSRKAKRHEPESKDRNLLPDVREFLQGKGQASAQRPAVLPPRSQQHTRPESFLHRLAAAQIGRRKSRDRIQAERKLNMNHETDKTGDGVFCDTAGAALTKWNLIAGAVVLIATLALTLINETQAAMMDQHAIENVVEALTESATPAPESEVVEE